MDFPVETFDLANCLNVLEHVSKMNIVKYTKYT